MRGAGSGPSRSTTSLFGVSISQSWSTSRKNSNAAPEDRMCRAVRITVDEDLERGPTRGPSRAAEDADGVPIGVPEREVVLRCRKPRDPTGDPVAFVPGDGIVRYTESGLSTPQRVPGVLRPRGARGG